MDLITLGVVGMLNIACFFVGAMVGERAVKVPAPEPDHKEEKPNPIDAYVKEREKRLSEEEKTRLETILRNVERYDGTSRGQEDVR